MFNLSPLCVSPIVHLCPSVVCVCVCGSSYPPILAENYSHREDVRQKLNDSSEWSKYSKLVAKSITEPVRRVVWLGCVVGG